jgi:hypothetical protein
MAALSPRTGWIKEKGSHVPPLQRLPGGRGLPTTGRTASQERVPPVEQAPRSQILATSATMRMRFARRVTGVGPARSAIGP